MADEEGAQADGQGSVRALVRDALTKPARNVVFAARADDPRARRPADIARLVVSAVIFVLAAWSYNDEGDLDRRVAEAFAEDLPGWISGPFTIIFVLGTLYSVILLVSILLFGAGRAAVARDMLVAGLLAGGAAIGASLIVGPEWPDIVPELLERDGVPSYPLLRLAFATALIRVAGPYLSAPMRHVGGRLIAGMVIASLFLGYGNVSSILGGLALGVGAAAAVHLMFGSGVGIPSPARIRDALAAIGIEVDEVEYLDDQPIGATLVRGHRVSGDSVLVKVYGRDAVDSAFAARAWRSLWYRDTRRAISATGLQQVEHESLMLLEAQRAGASVPELIAWGPGQTGDALIAARSVGGVRFASLDGEQVDDSTLDHCWRALSELHEAGIAHRELDGGRIMVLDDRVVLADLTGAAMSSNALVRATDVAQMLVTTSVVVGMERAIAAARNSIGDEELATALSVVQASALPTVLQHDVKASDFKLKELRAATTDALGVEAPQLVQLARVTWGNVAMVALTVFAVTALIGALSDIGLDTIVDEVSNAAWGWVITAFLLAQLTNVGEWVSLTGFVPGVPLGPTLRFRYAISFISLAVPSEAGAITMNIRFMQKQGVPFAAAAAQGPLLTIFSKGFDVILLILSAQVIGESIDLDDIDGGPVLRIITLAVVLIVLGTIVTLTVPKIRHRLLPPIKEGLAAVRDSITDPRRLLRVAGGTLMQRLLFAMALAAVVQAYGSSISFGEAIFVNSIVSLFVGFMPVPGGIGVAEAALTAGLTAVGVPEGAALAAAVTHRMATAYLPPIYGWFTTRWLTENDYL